MRLFERVGVVTRFMNCMIGFRGTWIGVELG